MSEIPIAPIAKVTGQAIEAMTGNRDFLNEAAKDKPGMDVVGTIRAENLALREVIENAALKRFVKTFLSKNEYVSSGRLCQDLANKMAGVPADQVQPPKASIAGPAMEGLEYALDEPALKEMYLNLLAGAVNSAKASKVHPSFVETIRALSAQEVPVLELVLTYRSLPAIRLQNKSLIDASFQIVQTCVLNLVDPPSGIPLAINDLPMWVDNWQRLGLVDLTFSEWLSSPEDADVYDWAKHCPEYNTLAWKIHEGGLSGVREAAYDRGMIRATPLGLRFHEIVSQPD